MHATGEQQYTKLVRGVDLLCDEQKLNSVHQTGLRRNKCFYLFIYRTSPYFIVYKSPPYKSHPRVSAALLSDSYQESVLYLERVADT